jgi:hypothetical protein
MYKILGIKPGASGEEAGQAYKYLLTVWQTNRSSKDAASGIKAEDRLRKINIAYEILKKNLPPAPSKVKKSSPVKISLSLGAGAMILLAALAFSTGLFKPEKPAVPGLREEQTNSPASEKGNSEQAPAAPSPESTVQPAQEASPAAGSEMTEEMAIERVKKSHALLRNTSTESIVRIWTQENSDKLQIIGWKARKMDDEKYLVSFTAMDGAAPKGFYFDLDISTGEVVNLANRPELQKKYNIQYSQ